MPESWMEELRKAGGEYGAATGRPRRVGPFDAVASRYGIMCQNVDDIALTKLDVLSDFDTIPIITAYSIDGTITKDFVTDSRLEKAEPVIEELPGWKCDISGCRSWDELPENAKIIFLSLRSLSVIKYILYRPGQREKNIF